MKLNQIFWAGISCPKQEAFMNQMINKLNVKYMLV